MVARSYDIHIHPLGDSALVVELAHEVSQEAHHKIMHFLHQLEERPFHGFIEAVPTYTNVTVFYDPRKVAQVYSVHHTVYETVSEMMQMYTLKNDYEKEYHGQRVEIPVIYGGESGPDLAHVAKENGLTEEEVIQIHSSVEYVVFMIGFAPGFPFLGGMDKRIEMPRKEHPRANVPAGSVGIAGEQTGIYPFNSPGGWQIIGKTSVDLFLPTEDPPTRLQAGDRLKFVPV